MVKPANKIKLMRRETMLKMRRRLQAMMMMMLMTMTTKKNHYLKKRRSNIWVFSSRASELNFHFHYYSEVVAEETFIYRHASCGPRAIHPYPITSPPSSLSFSIFSFFPFLIYASSVFLLFIPPHSIRIVPLRFHAWMSQEASKR